MPPSLKFFSSICTQVGNVGRYLYNGGQHALKHVDHVRTYLHSVGRQRACLHLHICATLKFGFLMQKIGDFFFFAKNRSRSVRIHLDG